MLKACFRNPFLANCRRQISYVLIPYLENFLSQNSGVEDQLNGLPSGFSARSSGDGAASVAAARLGSRGLERLAVEDPDAVVFETSLAGLSPDVQSRLVASEIMLRSIDGGRFTM